MRRTSRNLRGNHDEPGGAHGSGPPKTTNATTPLPPQTPRHLRSGDELNQLVQVLEREWNLGLKIRDSSWSPHVSKGLPDTVYGQIQRLFYSAESSLNLALNTFRATALGLPKEGRLNFLHIILKGVAQSIHSNTPEGRLTSLQPSNEKVRASPRFSTAQRDQNAIATNHITTPEPSTPKPLDDNDSDEDVDEYHTPRSSSPTVAASQRKAELTSSKTRISPSKRRYSGASSDSRSPKLCKSDYSPQMGCRSRPDRTHTFEKPTLEMARSFQSRTIASVPSATTSSESIWSSSQQTLVDTADTSFTTDAGVDENMNSKSYDARSLYPDLSAGISKAALLGIGTVEYDRERERESEHILLQGQGHEPSSSYGSIDDDFFRSTLYKTDSDNDLVSKGTNHRTQESSNQQGTVSFVKPSTSISTKVSPDALQRSPSKFPWYIQELPEHNLFIDEPPNDYSKLPYFLQFICCRLSIYNKVSMQEIVRGVNFDQAQSGPDAFWSQVKTGTLSTPHESSAVWSAAKRSFKSYTFKGKLVLNPLQSKPVFSLELLPIASETSCQLQRMFGSDRFLYLTLPPLDKAPTRFVQTDMAQIAERVRKHWLNKTHSFLGRKWRAFHIQPIDKKGLQKKDNTTDMRVILFATHGSDIDRPMTVGQMINEFFNFAKNKDQNFCKAFARLELGLSRTTPTLVFKPSQIRRIRDKFADGTPEAKEFDDEGLDWSEQCEKEPEMNDGCSCISVGAMLQVWEIYRKATGSDDPLPSAIQGRIAGAKGMWMISAESHTKDPFHLEVWIEITDSQLKFKPPDDDEDEETCNAHRLTFNHVKHTYTATPASLHSAFIPILVDRGVHRDTIADLIESHLSEERAHLMKIVHNPVHLHNWITKQGSTPPASGVLQWQASLPLTLVERTKLLLRVGFSPDHCLFLANLVVRFIEDRLSWIEEKLRAPIGKATSLLGLADPLGVLKPGEIHVKFTKPFVDEYDRRTYHSLANEDVLAARQPACRRSDIQKLRAVSHPQLAHLVDVVVFPSRGQYPTAGKLQGGDYDGDTFWLCWEPKLVQPFRNAPAPLNPLSPSQFGVRRDTRTLEKVMNTNDLSTVDNFLKEAFEFRTKRSLLGRVTTLAEHVAYRENKIYSERLNTLYGLHDILIDAAKQAYLFDDQDLKEVVHGPLKCARVDVPAYKKAMEANAKSRESGDETRIPSEEFKPKSDNIIDYLYFNVVRAHNEETCKQLQQAFENQELDDPILQHAYLEFKNSDSEISSNILTDLRTGIDKILNAWNSGFGERGIAYDKFARVVETCHASFRALVPSPTYTSMPKIQPLMKHYMGPNHPTHWEVIRASFLYTMYPKKTKFVWRMAGRELARLKAADNPDAYHVIPAVFADLKAKPYRPGKQEEGLDESDDDLESLAESWVDCLVE